MVAMVELYYWSFFVAGILTGAVAFALLGSS